MKITPLRRLAALVAAIAGTAVLAVAPGIAQAGQYDYLLPPAGTCGYAESNASAAEVAQADAAECLVNAARTRYGVRPAATSGLLEIAAYFKARDIGTCQWDANPHTACGRPVDYWLNRYSGWQSYCTAGAWAENVFPTWTGFSTARDAVRGWLDSQPHRQAMLNGQYTHQGMNVKKFTSYRGHPGAQIWVNYFCR